VRHTDISNFMKPTLLLFFIVCMNVAIAQNSCSMKGRITDNNGDAIPYCSIFLPELSTGSMANIDGEFALNLSCGEHEVIIQSLGYEIKRIVYKVDENSDELNVSLKQVSYELQEITIDPSSEDPAYNIIRKATVMAEFYKKQIKEYQCKLYIRSFFNVKDLPWIAEKFADEEDLAKMKAGDIQETLLEYSFKRPNLVKEKIIAQKTGGNDSLRDGSSYINLNFYSLGGPDMINPLSRSAFKVYKFEHIHTEFQGNQKVHKIKVIPRRKGNDLMKGHLYINDGLWNLNNVDVEFEQPLSTVYYQQLYQNVNDKVWMPINHQIKVLISGMGAELNWQYLATLSDVKVISDPSVNKQIQKNTNLRTKEQRTVDSIPGQQMSNNLSKTEKKIESLIQKDKLSNNETLKLVRLIKKQERILEQDTVPENLQLGANRTIEYSDSAYAQNDSLWNEEREIPLSEEEKNIYVKRDSLQRVLDGDTIINKDRTLFGNILQFRGSLKSKNKNIRFRPKGLIVDLDVNFSTVDGLLISKELFSYEWNDRKGEFYRFTPTVEYAFARDAFMGHLDFTSQYNPEKRAGFTVSSGRRSTDFNRSDPMFPLVNTISTLVFTENYKKLFQEDFLTLEHHFDIKNGLTLSTSLEYADRSPLKNNTDFKLFDSNKEYTSNIPDNELLSNNVSLIEANKATTVSAKLSYTHKYYYRIFRGQKTMVSSKYPTFDLEYRQGLKGVFDSDGQYQLLSFAIHQSRSFRLIDQINYHLEAGTFLNNQSLYFADYKNFNAQPFYGLSNEESNSFKLLDSYSFNTNDYYFEGHLSIEDKHILLKYLPLLNNTNLTEKLHFNYLVTEQKKNYYEIGYSLDRIFLLVNAGAYVNFIDDEYKSFGFRVGINIE